LCIDMKCLEIFEVIIRGGIVYWNEMFGNIWGHY
jgi:hypothetical protein